jgi:hypothetical protein
MSLLRHIRLDYASGLCALTPLTPEARAWVDAHVTAETTWQGDTLFIELRDAPAFVEAMEEALAP